jgi:hypothetical protein
MKDILVSDVVKIPPSRRTYVSDARWPLPNCNVGVELEYENSLFLQDSFNQKKSQYWTIVADDSLRNNGAEFIFSEPLSGIDLTTGINEMRNRLDVLRKLGPKYLPDPHYRTSTHVHLDVRDCTLAQYMNIILLGIMFEPALFRIAGEHRQRNNFSMSSRFASGYFEALSSAYNAVSGDALYDALHSQFKYTAINVTPPFNEERAHPKKGSIEFRHHEGTLDMDKLSTWISILMCLKKAAVNNYLFSDEWMHDVSAGRMLPIMQAIFGEYTKLLVYDNMEIDLIEGARLVQDIVHMHPLRDTKKLVDLDVRLFQTKQ